MGEAFWTVTIPNWEDSVEISKKTAPKYWLWKHRSKLPKKYREVLRSTPLNVRGKDYCCDQNGERLLKNTKKAGTPRIWVVNGQDLYNGTLHPLVRSKVTHYYHEYLAGYIREQLSPIEVPEGYRLSISCDVYEIRRGTQPDIGNLWPLIKYFEDALQKENIIEDDNPDFVRESGRKRYVWVEEESERKLVFFIELIPEND